MKVFVVHFIKRPVEIRGDFNSAISEVGDKARRDLCLVFIDDADADRQIMHGTGSNGKQRSARREQKELNTVFLVPPADVAQDREGRVIKDHAPVRIFIRLVVSAGKEWTDNLRRLQIVALQNPGLHRLVHVRWRVAVVARALRLKLVHECLVLFSVFRFLVPIVVRLDPGAFDSGDFDPGGVKADQRNIEAGGLEGLRFAAQRLLVVAGLAEQVVRVNKGPVLFLAEILDRHGRYFGPAFRLGCQQPAVSVDHAVLAVDADRDDHAELPEGSPEAFDLLGRVQFRVMLVWMEL